ncbi:MAG: YdbL family protein [Paraglaciecola sp.]|uniref:YdbL family protein n=1 Tax=Pseudomonadati TaxID=3379134 RepID=UPI00273FD286|nr:YdbL family protein [Paraglaciecola sp.]MDP5030605.1 YdbL family protein [Paraglaciecola sp.]MDP5040671.1 YdbL family protein [Paraglaciecola sp.]MDP5129682.1 YdbL family protein [Paraglaciecola sp.]
MKINFYRQILLIISLCFSSLTFALELDDAKQQGLVGEKDNGYLGVVVAQADAQALVNEVNQKRRDIYVDLAAKNNITLEQVEKLAAQKAYAKTLSGHYLWVNGSWQKK